MVMLEEASVVVVVGSVGGSAADRFNMNSKNEIGFEIEFRFGFYLGYYSCSRYWCIGSTIALPN